MLANILKDFYSMLIRIYSIRVLFSRQSVLVIKKSLLMFQIHINVISEDATQHPLALVLSSQGNVDWEIYLTDNSIVIDRYYMVGISS